MTLEAEMHQYWLKVWKINLYHKQHVDIIIL